MQVALFLRRLVRGDRTHLRHLDLIDDDMREDPEAQRIFRRRVELGATSRLELTQVELLWQQARLLVAQLQQAQATQANALNLLVGSCELLRGKKLQKGARVLALVVRIRRRRRGPRARRADDLLRPRRAGSGRAAGDRPRAGLRTPQVLQLPQVARRRLLHSAATALARRLLPAIQ